MRRACCVCIVCFVWLFVKGQSVLPAKLPLDQQRLLLEQSSSFLSAKRLVVIDFDSCLTLAARYFHISKASVILEGFGDPDIRSEGGWIDRNDPGTVRQRLSEARGEDRVRILALLGAYYAFRPLNDRGAADSAIVYLRQATQEAATIHNGKWERLGLCLLGKAYEHKWDTTSANRYFQQAIGECRSVKDSIGEALAWKYWGAYYPYIPAADMSRIPRLRNALTLYQRQKDVCNCIDIQMYIGYLLYPQFLLEDAKAAFTASVRLQDSIGWPYVHYSTDLLALLGEAEGRYGDNLRYALRSVKSAEAAGDSFTLAEFYNRLAEVYTSQDQKGGAAFEWKLKAIRASFNKDSTLADPDVYSYAANVVSYLCGTGQSKRADSLLSDMLQKEPPRDEIGRFWFYICKTKLLWYAHQYDQAEKFAVLAHESELSMERISGPLYTGFSLVWLGEVYYARKQYDKAETALRSYLESPFFHRVPNSANTIDALFILVRIDSVKKDFRTAFNDYHRYIKLSEEYYNVMQSRQAEQLSVEYETDRREKDIALLQAQSTLQQNELRSTAFTRKIAICGGVLGLLLAVLAYSRYRIKQRSNEQLERQKTEIDAKNTQLLQLVKEKDELLDTKEWLLREVHHRVKNNLQIMINLLNLQSDSLSGDALQAVTESRNRLYAMSIIHQMLYNPDNSTRIDMKYYVGALAQYMEETFGPWKNIRLQLSLQSVWLDVTQAIAVGLILNEAMTNSVKYAFRDASPDRPGVLEVTIRQEESGPNEMPSIFVEISDNGPGIPQGIVINESASLGLSLIHMLAEDLSGQLCVDSSSGTRITFRFNQLALLDSEARLIPA